MNERNDVVERALAYPYATPICVLRPARHEDFLDRSRSRSTVESACRCSPDGSNADTDGGSRASSTRSATDAGRSSFPPDSRASTSSTPPTSLRYGGYRPRRSMRSGLTGIRRSTYLYMTRQLGVVTGDTRATTSSSRCYAGESRSASPPRSTAPVARGCGGTSSRRDGCPLIYAAARLARRLLRAGRPAARGRRSQRRQGRGARRDRVARLGPWATLARPRGNSTGARSLAAVARLARAERWHAPHRYHSRGRAPAP